MLVVSPRGIFSCTPDPQNGHCNLTPLDSEIWTRSNGSLRYWGRETQKALDLLGPHCPTRAVDAFPEILHAIGWIKEAAAQANYDLGGFQNVAFPDGTPVPPEAVRDAIVTASRRWASGELDQHMPLPAVVSGAGTSFNMNANEVIARLANDLLWKSHSPGTLYAPQSDRPIHPNDHVNMAQSTNDVNPTAIRIGFALRHNGVANGCQALINALKAKEGSSEFQETVMIGRTHLQDAVLITAAQIFGGWRASLEGALAESDRAAKELLRSTLGATAAGTGITTTEGYEELVRHNLNKILDREGTCFWLDKEPNLPASTSSGLPLLRYHNSLACIAVELKRMCDDLRRHASGPIAGFGDMVLPELAKGSSIMPGKVNPIGPERGTITELIVSGNAATVCNAARAGEHQLNVFLIGALLSIATSQRELTSVPEMLATHVIAGLTLNYERIRANVDSSYCVATGLSPVIGYDAAAKLAAAVVRERITVESILCSPERLDELHIEMSEAQLTEALQMVRNPRSLTEPEHRASSPIAGSPVH